MKARGLVTIKGKGYGYGEGVWWSAGKRFGCNRIGLVILEGIGDGKNNFDKIVRGLPWNKNIWWW